MNKYMKKVRLLKISMVGIKASTQSEQMKNMVMECRFGKTVICTKVTGSMG